MPVDGIAADPIYLDVSVPPGKRNTLPAETTRHAFAYVFAGDGKFRKASEPLAVPTESVGWADTHPPSDAENRSLVVFDSGDEVAVQAGENETRFLLVSGKPLEEPVPWYGPIVVNTGAVAEGVPGTATGDVPEEVVPMQADSGFLASVGMTTTKRIFLHHA